ncbi:mitotic checkpoint serine/threonine-protein kinase BUB1 beta isoform X1 [Ascaphus truei]|uniref:mitotic checkpoint serine/threonine-protein kinase BUB1 beta isoform X1 n=1 Tax=Ascaphus truei TaxID=8439 RepID=UPI003F591D03
MAQAGDEWELSKENVQPLRQGRVMSTLQEVLSQQESASYTPIQQQKQAFEIEIRFYTGEDPLDVWDRYIKWAEQAFPQGGNESNLCPLLERVVKIFHEEKRYYGDLRFLKLCLKFAHFCSEPLEVYSYLHSQGIGISFALLYITWAEQYESRGNFKKADSIFQEGIQHKAEPMDKLEVHHRQFQARVSRQVVQGISEGTEAEDSDVPDPQRSSLADLKSRGKNKARAPVSRVGDAIKLRNQGHSAQTAPPQQIPGQSRIAVFDENGAGPVHAELPSLNPQQWVAPPPARAKENELRAGPWNAGRSGRSSHGNPDTQPPHTMPSFTPYVEESAQQQTVTPCKINPAITSVLSARKPGKEEDPLQRVQNNAQGREEKVMYCKDKVYAGMEEFSFEEIRAEIYVPKMRKKRAEALEARALRRKEMERQIAEMEKKLKEKSVGAEQTAAQQPAQDEGPRSFSCNSAGAATCSEAESGQSAAETLLSSDSPCTAPDVPSPGVLPVPLVPQNLPSSMDLSATFSSNVPFTIFDESASSGLSQNQMLPPKRRTLSIPETRDGAKPIKATLSVSDELDGIEPLNEEVLFGSSEENKTLFPNPEDTCDFVRAAHLASTPFHGANAAREESDLGAEESVKSNAPALERLPLREKTPVCEESYNQTICIKKLSPILEASQEDTRSSVSSVSSTFSSKSLHVPEKLELFNDVIGVSEQSLGEIPRAVQGANLRRQLLEPLSELFSSSAVHHESGPIPIMKAQAEVELGCETYCLKREILLSSENRIYLGVPADRDTGDMKGVALKVDSHPVPWDFYITLQLKERLGEAFETNFVEQSNCFLFQDGCISLYKDINHCSVEDVLQTIKVLDQELFVFFAYNLLSLVEKLHTAEIVHGNLRPETLLFGDQIFDQSSCNEMDSVLKLIDFSHSVDMRLCPTMTSLTGFPIVQTQPILMHGLSPYHVDLLGIADVVHLMVFRKPLEVYQEDSTWKIRREVPINKCGDLWNKFFTRILNADVGSAAPVLRELRNEMIPLLDSCFQVKLSAFFLQLDMYFNCV